MEWTKLAIKVLNNSHLSDDDMFAIEDLAKKYHLDKVDATVVGDYIDIHSI